MSGKLEQLLDAYAAHLQGDADPAWAGVFSNLDPAARAWLDARASRNGAPATTTLKTPATQGKPLTPAAPAVAGVSGDALRTARDATRALMLIRAYRVRGHLEAKLDPLKLQPHVPHPELQPATYGFGPHDLDRPILLDGVLGLESATMREILKRVRRIYCGPVGIEYMHLQDPEQKAWIQEHMENVDWGKMLSVEDRREILRGLTVAECFEKFLDKKYTGTKRFGLDGAESMIPALETMVRQGAKAGIQEMVFGMAHRGRLNVLANVLEKPLQAIFTEFQGGALNDDDIGGSGDVKYHLGTSTDRKIGDHTMHMSLAPNPSHLEAVDPVVIGKVRARQDMEGDTDKSRIVGVLLHGDAAFAGQGIVAETLQFLELPGYRTGGIIHFIINNQIGFTTNPMAGRSSPYCSDVAKMTQAPIVHVNADRPEAVVLSMQMALEFRQRFKRDVVLDMVCYRRYGHNESDEPAFTQPIMYRAIKSHPTVRALYAQYLAEKGVVPAADAESMITEFNETLEAEFEATPNYVSDHEDWLEGAWSGLEAMVGYDARRGDTAVEPDVLRDVGKALTTVPQDFNLNRKIARQLKAKKAMLDSGKGIDWATAEALAFGSLLVEGHPVRLSGEDVNRGTFSQRHASWIDQETEARYVPLNHIERKQERFDVLDSPLSEFGVLGFEYGYSLASPKTLVLWEAQFGDFANGAQVIIDQFISGGETKWHRMSGLVLLLPHGYEGQGPEHSSARPERFLQLCAEDNLQVVNCTTPANYFHVLRRQMHRNFRKPLVVLSPKSLLRHKRVVSKLEDFGPGTSFHRILHDDDPVSKPKDAKQVVLCSGKVYYDLLEAREEAKQKDVHLLRLEQLYPFPIDALAQELEPYKHCHLVWCQEEPRNMGAWPVVGEVIEEMAHEIGCKHPEVRYAGRRTAAAPATGSARRHAGEQQRLVTDALTVGRPPKGRIASRRDREEARNGKSAKPKVNAG